jgi:hypothetical protein
MPAWKELIDVSRQVLSKNGQATKTLPPTVVPTKKNRPRTATRRLWTDRTLRRWLVAWVSAPVLAIVNGAAREFAYKDQVGESTANQISVAPLIALLALYFWILQRRWPLATRRDALSIGAIWVSLSVLFEFGWGHYVESDSWTDLLQNYDVTEGNLWLLILLWVAAGPATVRAIAPGRPVDAQ